MGTFNVHELFWMLQCHRIDIYCFNPRLRQFFFPKLGIAVHLWKREPLRTAEADPHTIDSLFFVFLRTSGAKRKKIALTKRWLEGRLESFKVSSWFLKIMKLVEYRIAKKCYVFHHCCRWLHHHKREWARSFSLDHHHLWGCHARFYLMKQSLTLTTWF